MITDAISTPGPATYSDAAVRAVNAGVDVVLFTDSEAQTAAGFKQLLQAARAARSSAQRCSSPTTACSR